MKNLLRIMSKMTLALMLTNCSPIKTVIGNAKPDELIVKKSMRSYMKTNPSPRIAIRVTGTLPKSMLQTQNMDVGLQSLEKELTKAEFQVKDRVLLEQVLEKNLKESKVINYATIQSQIEADVILEITGLKEIKYKTNQYQTPDGSTKTWKNGQVELSGIELTCRLVLLQQNDVAAICTFNYIECADGCAYKLTKKGVAEKVRLVKKSKKVNAVDGYEQSDDLRYEDFMRSVAQRLIKELRQE